MGVINVTPDSFSDGGVFIDTELALEQARRMLADGAQIIDVGGESTKPGADAVAITEELARVLPVVSELAREGAAVSIDTRHVEVASAAVEAGACIINDVTGFRDPEMRRLAADQGVGCVIMHMLGDPTNMQIDPRYDDVVAEVRSFLLGQAELLIGDGVAADCICIDPGPGFGKTYDHNLALLKATAELSSLGYPLMAAYSRKGFIGKLTGVEEPVQRVAGSVAVEVWAASQGALVLRVHDVKPTVEALRVWQALRG